MALLFHSLIRFTRFIILWLDNKYNEHAAMLNSRIIMRHYSSNLALNHFDVEYFCGG